MIQGLDAWVSWCLVVVEVVISYTPQWGVYVFDWDGDDDGEPLWGGVVTSYTPQWGVYVFV